MKVCLFGSYSSDEMINLLKKKLELQGIEVIECQETMGKSVTSFFSASVKLILKHRKLDYDVLIIPLWRAVFTLPLAKVLSKKPIVYYGYIPIYDSIVNDRKIAKANSLKAKSIYFVEKMCWRLCDMIIKESEAEIDYFTKQFHIDKKKFRKVLIGADDSKFPPCPIKKANPKFVVLYHGTFIPHHGVETIVESAKILSEKSDIKFKLCGDGLTKVASENLARKYDLKNIEFPGWIKFEKLHNQLNESDVCLGIFADSSKATYGITNKTYQILCSQKALITRDSPAIREINAKNGKHCLLIPPNEPAKLAEAILFLKNNEEKRQEIAIEGHKLFEESLSLEKTSKHLADCLNELIKN